MSDYAGVNECPKCLWWVKVEFFRYPREHPCGLCADVCPLPAVPYCELTNG